MKLRNAIAVLEALPVVTPCMYCDHLRGDYCDRWRATVPEASRAAGCGEWIEGVPF